jgi:membrane-associated phospholipid phosphatase
MVTQSIPEPVMAATAHTLPPLNYLESERRVSRRPPFVREIALAVIAYLIYEAARLLTAGSYPSALAHAQQVIALERDVNLDVEGTIQRAFLDSPMLTALNYVYLVAQNLVLPASLVLLYRVNRTVYTTLRNTLLATWLLALPVYALFPAAPPRLAGLGIADTVSDGSPLKMEGGATTTLVNQFAAVPSLHVGFAFAIGIALAAALRSPVLRFAALLWGPLVLLSVVATGNHFVFDALAGLLITAAGYGAGRVVSNGWPARWTSAAYALGTRRRIEPAPAMA